MGKYKNKFKKKIIEEIIEEIIKGFEVKQFYNDWYKQYILKEEIKEGKICLNCSGKIKLDKTTRTKKE